MAEIMINCPKTNQPVPTGFSADQKSFESSDYKANSFQCPACGNVHTWDKKDAWVRSLS
jgi:predicted RNA-binding Zn-ribbon protein involved in translation (DUF1610 family)